VGGGLAGIYLEEGGRGSGDKHSGTCRDEANEGSALHSHSSARRPIVQAVLEALSLSDLLYAENDLHKHGQRIISTCFVLSGPQHQQTVHAEDWITFERDMLAQHPAKHTIMHMSSSSQQRRQQTFRHR
jgi:hypothetical protein